MPLTIFQLDVMGALAQQRCANSWVAGSMVIANWLSRAPHDIDIHHLDDTHMIDAMASDKKALTALGLESHPAKILDQEVEIRFTRGQDSIAINWVLETAEPLGGTMPDSLFGERASYAAIIYRKIEMYLESGSRKHAKDLAEIADSLPTIPDIPPHFANQIVRIGHTSRAQMDA